MLAFVSDRTSSHWKALETFDGSDRKFYKKTSNTCWDGASVSNLSSLYFGRNFTHHLFPFFSDTFTSFSSLIKKSYFLTAVACIFQVTISFHSLKTKFFSDMLIKQDTDWVLLSAGCEAECVSRRKNCKLGNLWEGSVCGDNGKKGKCLLKDWTLKGQGFLYFFISQ